MNLDKDGQYLYDEIVHAIKKSDPPSNYDSQLLKTMIDSKHYTIAGILNWVADAQLVDATLVEWTMLLTYANDNALKIIAQKHAILDKKYSVLQREVHDMKAACARMQSTVDNDDKQKDQFLVVQGIKKRKAKCDLLDARIHGARRRSYEKHLRQYAESSEECKDLTYDEASRRFDKACHESKDTNHTSDTDDKEKLKVEKKSLYDEVSRRFDKACHESKDTNPTSDTDDNEMLKLAKEYLTGENCNDVAGSFTYTHIKM
jgi:hypothetical protein